MNEPSLRSASVPDLARFLEGRRTLVLTGAGCSTESGIPDYRGPEGTLRHREPMRFGEFMGSEAARRRYWSRSMVGWPTFSAARPNAAHRALAELEELGLAGGVVTQNVDGLHQRAGARAVVELHGTLARVRCMGCGAVEARARMQERLEESNPGFRERPATRTPDGDAELPAGAEEGFVVPSCQVCGGVLKPDVVFFGESVPRERVRRCWALYEEADALLVVGSSLAVFSGRRFVLRAEKEGRPVAIVNLGATRADATAAVKVEGRVGRVLPELVETVRRSGRLLPSGDQVVALREERA